jgi:hypothetical protein
MFAKATRGDRMQKENVGKENECCDFAGSPFGFILLPILLPAISLMILFQFIGIQWNKYFKRSNKNAVPEGQNRIHPTRRDRA